MKTRNKINMKKFLSRQRKLCSVPKRQHIQLLYRLIPNVLVLYLSIYLNSSLRILWGEHCFINEILKLFKSILSPWTLLACKERAESSQLVGFLKHPLCVLVRLWLFWTVLKLILMTFNLSTRFTRLLNPFSQVTKNILGHNALCTPILARFDPSWVLIVDQVNNCSKM